MGKDDDAPRRRSASNVVCESTSPSNGSNDAAVVGSLGFYDEHGVFRVHPEKFMELSKARAQIELCAGLGNTALASHTTYPPREIAPTTWVFVTKEAAAVLQCLHQRAPVLSTLDDIEAAANLARSTAHKACNELTTAGYANRPQGPNKGIAITEEGARVANKLSTNS